MKIAICDDKIEDTCRLRSLIGPTHQVYCFSCAEALLSEVEEGNAGFDLYLLDIFMDGLDGISLARRLRKLDSDALLCIVSGSEEFYREAYDLYIFQYLIKPIQPSAVEELLERSAQQLKRNRERTVAIKTRGQILTLSYGKLAFIFSRGHNLYFQCTDGTILETRGRIDDVASRLDMEIFLRCHQSYIVNLYNCHRLIGNEFLCGDYHVPISRAYHTEAKRRFHAMLFQEMD